MKLVGKSIMSWNIPEISGGNPILFVKQLTDLNVEGVILKAADGNRVQVPNPVKYPKWGENIREELLNALRWANIKIFFWHFLYGIDPKGELEAARRQCDKFKPDGYVWDAESSFDRKPGAVSNAEFISGGLKSSHPNIGQGLCWWALPRSPTGQQWHPEVVAKAFFKYVDIGMPMMYWTETKPDAQAGVKYFERSYKLWRNMNSDIPILPVGRAYTGDGSIVSPLSIKNFADYIFNKQNAYNLVGTSWWSLDSAVKRNDILMALSDTPKFGGTPSLTLEEKVEVLVKGHPELFP